MRARPGVGGRPGPFLLPARVVLVVGGLLAVGLGTFNLAHELHGGQVNGLSAGIAEAVGIVWLACLALAFRDSRAAILLAAAIAFVEFALVASSHFVSGPAALGTFVKLEGLPVATVDMALVPACALVVMSAAVAWSNPRGRTTRLETLPILIAALIGAILVILQATDDLHRADFGSANLEDGAFAAAVLATAWLAGGLWIARVRRTGAILIALSTFIVGYAFITLHILGSGTSVSEIASKSGVIWAAIAGATAVLAGASFLLAVGLFVWSFARPRRARLPASQPVRRGA